MFLQHIANGLIQGSLYALVAVGLTLVYGVLEVVNFAHGELYMLAAFALYMAFAFLKLPYVVAVGLTMLVMMGLGLVLSRTAIVPHLRRSFETTVLATLAASIILQNGARFAFTATPRQVIVPLDDVIFSLGSVIVTGQRFPVVVVAALSLLGLQLYGLHLQLYPIHAILMRVLTNGLSM